MFRARGKQPRFSSEDFSHSVFIPLENYAVPGVTAAVGRTMDGLKAAGQLAKVVNQNGSISWVVLIPKKGGGS